MRAAQSSWTCFRELLNEAHPWHQILLPLSCSWPPLSCLQPCHQRPCPAPCQRAQCTCLRPCLPALRPCRQLRKLRPGLACGGSRFPSHATTETRRTRQSASQSMSNGPYTYGQLAAAAASLSSKKQTRAFPRGCW